MIHEQKTSRRAVNATDDFDSKLQTSSSSRR